MSGYLNRASIIGNLGADPEVRNTQNGSTVVTFSVATTESWKDKQTGQKAERTEWHRIVIFNEALGRLAGNHLKKGAKVFVEGQLKTRKWTDSAGMERYSTEIVLQGYGGTLTFLDSKRDGDTRAPRREPAAAGAGGDDASFSDDIPF